MDKRSILKDMSAADLREELLARLRDQIRRNEEENEKLREQIRQLMPQGAGKNAVRVSGGGRGQSRGPAVRNEQPLREIIVQVLKDAGEPLRVKDVLKRVKEAGYVSKASNFNGIVNISLSTNTELFEKVGRGLYKLRENVTSAVPDTE
jgi:hypothetical protein